MCDVCDELKVQWLAQKVKCARQRQESGEAHMAAERAARAKRAAENRRAGAKRAREALAAKRAAEEKAARNWLQSTLGELPE